MYKLKFVRKALTFLTCSALTLGIATSYSENYNSETANAARTIGEIQEQRNANAKKIQEQLNLGERYLTALQYEQAIAAYQAVIDIDPKNVDAYLGLAEVYIARGEYDMAVDILETALEVQIQLETCLNILLMMSFQKIVIYVA